jgi:hypothetical protein
MVGLLQVNVVERAGEGSHTKAKPALICLNREFSVAHMEEAGIKPDVDLPS